MDRFIHSPYEKRFFIAALIVVVLAYLFWTGSRYPALDEKAMMSGAIQLEDPLSFEAKFALSEGMSLLERIFWTTLNWINTNKKGMTFGVLFAAAFLTMLPLLKKKSFRGGFSNSFLGMVIGTPLGVCVNCAAPIARGMYSSGLRAETTLSAMIASPTLNIVVLTMLFSLLPFYMAVTKILLSLFMILIAVPLICRFLPQKSLPPEEMTCALPLLNMEENRRISRENIGMALIGVARSYAGNLWYIVKMTVPLMLLAGLLGAVAATLVPQGSIVNLPFAFGFVVLVAALGVFLPVPIAFDVVVTGALLSAGLMHGYVMTLLFTLGIFSIYSFFIVAQSVGLRAAVMLSACVVALGVGAGLGAQSYHQWQTERALKILIGADATPKHMWGAAQAATMDGVTVTATPFSPSSPAAETGFIRREADTIGIDKPLEFSFRDMWPPFWEGRSLASGDIDRDGDLDLVVSSTEAGLYLYANDGAGGFSRMDTTLGALAKLLVFNTVIADLDNDGWPDLFFTTYLDGNYIWRNVNGVFGPEPPQRVAMGQETLLSLAVSVADADRDGDLDVALGNWSAGWYRRIPGEEARNRILWNEGGTLTGDRFTDLPGMPGETLSILFSDVDRDGSTDLIVGNDFDIPDYFYRGDGNGGFDMIDHDSGLIPHTTTTTMAVKTADLHNTGRPDIYLAQIAGRSSGVSDTLKMQPLSQYCNKIENTDAKTICETNMAIKSWYKSGNNFDPTYAARCQTLGPRNARECQAMLIKDLAIQKRDSELCALIPATARIPRAYCDIHFKPPHRPTEAEIAVTHPQILRSNVLLSWEGRNWQDRAKAQGLDVGGWSWDTKIADFDLDGFQDVYIVNGTWVPNEVSPSNLFFHNTGQQNFVEASGPFGLEDYLMTAAATAFDIDNDGDLDLVTHPVNGPLMVFTNTSQRRGIVIVLNDHRGNRDGIGAVLTLTDDAGVTQSREVQIGGGFMSYDAPRVHFGLQDDHSAQTLHIRWADGSESDVPGPFEGGNLYTVSRP
ncbi:FG-GAP-like repeat-containing protein [Phaeobacter sp. J2-8]|uniref:FG-GAP-like repeat-containing protein n=1 Tax=Phaeobacter sp. J2-8 TaxID=2931394 RepID=UPI001FD1AB2D|nr:FG-GAP-like repeat-containing protein [Phaeobacter sp. J2-8]MCJ7874799.1 FG-GAP-like repeat-containing protein [Phaeobacter sp. J2-8]